MVDWGKKIVAEKDAEINRLRAGGCARDQGLTQHCAEAETLAREVDRLRIENLQMQAALGYGIPAEDERHIIPSNPYTCGTCGPKDDEITRLRAEVERLRAGLWDVLAASQKYC